jgi:hypothetical protein
MNKGRWWGDTDRGKLWYWEGKLRHWEEKLRYLEGTEVLGGN